MEINKTTRRSRDQPDMQKKENVFRKKSTSTKLGQLWKNLNIWQMDLMQSTMEKETKHIYIPTRFGVRSSGMRSYFFLVTISIGEAT